MTIKIGKNASGSYFGIVDVRQRRYITEAARNRATAEFLARKLAIYHEAMGEMYR